MDWVAISKLSMRRKSILFCIGVLILTTLTLSSPIYPQSQPPPSGKNVKRHTDVMHGTVQVFTKQALTVRDKKNPLYVRTFSYSQKLFPKMQKRQYKWGQKVKVKYIRGTDIAVSIK